MSFRVSARGLAMLSVALVSACGEPSGNNKPGPPAKIVLLSEPMFTATVGTPLQSPVVALVTDDADRPVPGVPVQFSVRQGVATVNPSRDTTDAEGKAQTTLLVGTTAGTIEVRVSVTGITAPVLVTGVAVPGALADIILTPEPLFIKAVGDTGRLVANFRDQFGNPIPPSLLTWRSLDEAVATVDQSGLVTGRTLGASTQIIATATNGAADTATVSVSDPNASICASSAVTLAPGQTTTLDPARGTCIRATESSQYVAIPFFASASNNNVTDELRVSGKGLATFTGSLAPMPSVSASRSALAGPGPRPSASVEERIRRMERRVLTPHFESARSRIGSRTRTGPSFNLVPAANVGDFLTLNASGTNACTTPNTRVGRVAAISQKAVIVADTSNPSGGFTDADYARIAATFDTLVVPVNELTFGAPNDMDGNGRSVIFYTGAVNQLTEPGSQTYVGGFFFGRDLFPKAQCATSNEGEIFYMLVPDPDKVLGNTFSKAFVEQVTIGTLAHEYQHLINASRRLANPAVESFEETWLNEGLSHIAEEMVFYRASGLTPRRNIDASFFGTSPFDQAYASYMAQNIGRLRSWLGAPQSNTPYAANDELATRGSAWLFLRYLADRTAATDGDIWRRLVDNVETGMANVDEVFAVNTISAVKDWSIAMYADDFAAGIPPTYKILSWNLRSVFPGMASSSLASVRNRASPYPLLVTPLADGVEYPVTLRGGGSAYFPFAVAAGSDAQVRVLTAAGAAPPAGVTVTILRTR